MFVRRLRWESFFYSLAEFQVPLSIVSGFRRVSGYQRPNSVGKGKGWLRICHSTGLSMGDSNRLPSGKKIFPPERFGPYQFNVGTGRYMLN